MIKLYVSSPQMAPKKRKAVVPLQSASRKTRLSSRTQDWVRTGHMLEFLVSLELHEALIPEILCLVVDYLVCSVAFTVGADSYLAAIDLTPLGRASACGRRSLEIRRDSSLFGEHDGFAFLSYEENFSRTSIFVVDLSTGRRVSRMVYPRGADCSLAKHGAQLYCVVLHAEIYIQMGKSESAMLGSVFEVDRNMQFNKIMDLVHLMDLVNPTGPAFSAVIERSGMSNMVNPPSHIVGNDLVVTWTQFVVAFDLSVRGTCVGRPIRIPGRIRGVQPPYWISKVPATVRNQLQSDADGRAQLCTGVTHAEPCAFPVIGSVGLYYIQEHSRAVLLLRDGATAGSMESFVTKGATRGLGSIQVLGVLGQIYIFERGDGVWLAENGMLKPVGRVDIEKDILNIHSDYHLTTSFCLVDA